MNEEIINTEFEEIKKHYDVLFEEYIKAKIQIREQEIDFENRLKNKIVSMQEKNEENINRIFGLVEKYAKQVSKKDKITLQELNNILRVVFNYEVK